MPLTVRLDPGTERRLEQLARRTRQTRSDIVREALERYAAEQATATGDGSAQAAWADVIGIVASNGRDDHRNTGERFTEVARRKARDRRAG